MATIEAYNAPPERFMQDEPSRLVIRGDSSLRKFVGGTVKTIDGKLVISPPETELKPFQPIPGRYAQAEDGKLYRCVGEKHNGLWVFQCVTNGWGHFHFHSNGQHAYTSSIKGLTHLMPPDFEPEGE